MKRTLSLVLALVMVLGSFTTVFAQTAQELEAAEILADLGVLQGDDDGDLMLDKDLERRDAVVLLSRLLGVEEEAAETEVEDYPTWADVDTDAYYLGYFTWAEVNGLFEGDDEGNFRPRDMMTAQDYALVLLRALGYDVTGHEAWTVSLETAKAAGILAGLEVENKDVVSRGLMASLVLNTLKANVKDSEETLAEKLELVLPEPEVVEATKAEEAYAENLKEVVVVFDGEVDKATAEEKENYSVNKNIKVEDAVLSEDLTTVVLAVSEMKNQTAYQVTVSRVKAGDAVLPQAKLNFVTLDNSLPEVEEVVSLGTKAIKVYASEPIKTVSTSNFKLDGKSFFGTATKDGRVITLKPYNSSTVLTAGDHTLEVEGLVDYMSFKSLKQEFTFEVVEDNDAPVVVDYTATLEKVVLTFDEDIDPDTVKRTGFYWLQGSVKKYPVVGNPEVSGNRITLDFTNNPLPGYEVTLVIDGAADYSGNKLDKAEVAIVATVDQTRPVVLDASLDEDDAYIINVKFDKNVKGTDKADYVLKNSDDKTVTIRRINKIDDKNYEVELYSDLKEGVYSLTISGVSDLTALKNTMLPQTFEIEVGDVTAPKVSSYSVSGRTVIVNFSEEMKYDTIADPNNYLVEIDGSWRRIPTGTEFTVLNSGKAVRIIFPEEINNKDDYVLQNLQILGAEDLAGKLIEVNVGNNPMDLTTKDAIALARYATSVDSDVYAALTDSKTLKIRFNQAIGQATADAITAGTESIASIEADGTNLVVVNFTNDLGTDKAKLANVSIKAGGLTSLVGNDVKALSFTEANIADQVKPKVTNEDELTLAGTNTFVIDFSEDLNDKVQSLIAHDLIVVRELDNKTLVAGEGRDFTAKVVGNTIEVTILAGADASFYTVQVRDGARYIMDLNSNVAAESDVFGTVEFSTK